MINLKLNDRGAYPKSRQKGIATLLTVILMLFMLTIVAIYSTKVGMFDQMASANDTRQKQAFHAAEAGIDIMIERIKANLINILSSKADGWFSGGGNQHWIACSEVTIDDTHPCYAEKDIARREFTYFYAENAAPPYITSASLGVEMADVLDSSQSVEVGAILCPLKMDYSATIPKVVGCTDEPSSEMMLTLISRGTSDNGRGQAIVKQAFADFDFGGGVPSVPLTAPLVGLPSGTADIVANPNGGGEGVPLSVWSEKEFDDNGAVRTCEAYEFYDQYSLPDDISCPGCDCTAGEELSSKFTRYSDIHDNDDGFPDDLFKDFFGTPKSGYKDVRSTMKNVSSDECADFDEDTTGAYWIDGGCSIGGGGNTCQIGTQDNPVFLVINGDFKSTGCDVYGLLFITNAVDENEFYGVQMNGNATVYGAIMVDHDVQQFNGTFAIVYNGDVLERANKFNGIAPLPGGWSDFL